MTLLDTGDFYGMGHNELLISEALRTAPAALRENALLSVKFGALRDPDGSWAYFDGRPAAVKNFAAYSLQRLGVDHIDVYRPSRLDPQVPIEETVGAIAELVEKGWVRHIGLSEVGADTIRRAAATAPIADLQIEYALISRGPEREILPTLRELGISVTAYGVLARGLISGHFTADRQLAAHDFRAHAPRFQGENRRRQPHPGRVPAQDRRTEGRHRRPDRHRLGARPGRGHRPAGRRQDPRPARGGPGRPGRDPGRRRPRRAGGRRTGGLGGR